MEAIINLISKTPMLLSILLIGVGVYGLMKSIINIYESIVTKACGEYTEATVINGER